MMRTRILPLLITMLFALSLASNAAANENSKMTPGTIAVVNNPDSNDRLNLRDPPHNCAQTIHIIPATQISRKSAIQAHYLHTK